MTIRTASTADAKALAEIYNHYIVNSTATFEEVVLSAEDMKQRVLAVAELGLPWLVAEQQGQVVGYAYANRWKERSAYRFSVESTVVLSKILAPRVFEMLASSLSNVYLLMPIPPRGSVDDILFPCSVERAN